jgi:hypothetical protein
MDYSNRKWVIITLTDYSDDELDILCLNAIESNVTTLRKTLDNSKAILKWDGDTPSCFDGLTTYTHSEILTELAGSDWSEE